MRIPLNTFRDLLQVGFFRVHIIRPDQLVPSLEMTVRISNALSVTVDQLLRADYENPEKVYLQEIAERIGKYPHRKKLQACESVMSYLDSLERFGG